MDPNEKVYAFINSLSDEGVDRVYSIIEKRNLGLESAIIGTGLGAIINSARSLYIKNKAKKNKTKDEKEFVENLLAFMKSLDKKQEKKISNGGLRSDELYGKQKSLISKVIKSKMKVEKNLKNSTRSVGSSAVKGAITGLIAGGTIGGTVQKTTYHSNIEDSYTATGSPGGGNIGAMGGNTNRGMKSLPEGYHEKARKYAIDKMLSKKDNK